ncbi:MAG: hypothetical protein JRJ13_06850 [Deltaproteobacteria bacterium]|nr:hypothetical protein [Deltaproteobacteria bacterium]MBW2026582.1 hypothetical protein [Deltaproteobacteria bacterium]
MKIKKRQEDTIEGDEAKEETVIFKVVYVWDVSQTEGRPLPEAPDTISVEGSISDLLLVIETIIRSHGIDIEYVTHLSRGYGMSTMGHIKILSTLNDDEKFHVLTHEFAHELLHGHQERMNLPRKIKELEAEATAYIVCRHFSLDVKAPTYLALYRVEEVDIKNSLERILSTASRIIKGIVKNREGNRLAKAA